MKNILFTLLVLFGFSNTVSAETWSETNVEYLYGSGFDKIAGGDSVNDGSMETITLTHIGGWEYGSNFFFVDLTSADFASGKKHTTYAEWAPKVSLSKVSGSNLSYEFIKDIYLAGEINQSDNFRANNIGLGLGLKVIGFNFFDINLFTRKDNYNDRTSQITIVWGSDFELKNLPLTFEGFLDYYGTNSGEEIISQPRLMLDADVFSNKTKDLQVGLELYYYKSSSSKANKAVPQLVAMWIW